MKNIQTIKGFPLIKFQCKDKIKNIRQGEIYMKNLKWYRERETANGNTVVGDKLEGLLHFSNASLKIPDLDYQIDMNNEALQTDYTNDFAFCMSYINPQLQNFRFSEEQKKELLSFGDTALLITDTYEFIRRILNSAENKGLKAYHGKVNYYDVNVDSAAMILSLLQGMHNVAFWKRDSYALQQEYRFLLHSVKTDDDFFILKIGDISDISVVMETTTMLKAEIKPCKQ